MTEIDPNDDVECMLLADDLVKSLRDKDSFPEHWGMTWYQALEWLRNHNPACVPQRAPFAR